jgi:hypothetical protein
VGGKSPTNFDLDDVEAVVLIDRIRSDYGELLEGQTHPYAGCLFMPASLLPYPKAVVKGALTALLDFAEGRRSSSLLDQDMRTPQVAESIRSALVFLDNFLDIPAERLPTDPKENARAGFQYQREAT